jgi:hypothetical protein
MIKQLCTSFPSHAIRGVIDGSARQRKSMREIRYGVKTYGRNSVRYLNSGDVRRARMQNACALRHLPRGFPPAEPIRDPRVSLLESRRPADPYRSNRTRANQPRAIPHAPPISDRVGAQIRLDHPRRQRTRRVKAAAEANRRASCRRASRRRTERARRRACRRTEPLSELSGFM